MTDKLKPKHIPTSGRTPIRDFDRDSPSNIGAGQPANQSGKGGVALPPPVIFRAPIGKSGKPENGGA